jgi:hypothetical protein
VENRESNFGFSIYPQLVLNNSTRSVGREIVEPGPQFLLPAEANANATIGPLRIKPKARESTLGVGWRCPIAGDRSLWFMGMAGRSLVTVTRTNGQPSWIASIGFQILTGRRRRYSSD